MHVGGGRTTDPNDPQGPLDFLDNSRGNYFRATTGPAIHVTTSPFGIQGRARIIGNHFDDYFFATPLVVDLGPEGPTPNDPGDPDAGPNDSQNKPELLFEPMRFPPEEGDPPGPPCTASNNYADCDGVRVTVRLAGAPTGTYTAELPRRERRSALRRQPRHPPVPVDGRHDPHRFGRPRLRVRDERLDSAHRRRARRFRSGGAFSLPPIRALVSQGGIDSFDGATSEIVQAGDTQPAAAADVHALLRRRRRRLVLRHDLLALELRQRRGDRDDDASTPTRARSSRTPCRSRRAVVP